MVHKSLFLVLLLGGVAWADTGYKNTIKVTETDNSPQCTAGQLVFQPGQVTCAGQKATLNITGGGGGSSSLAIWDGTTKVSSPTASIRFETDQFVVGLTGSATAEVSLNVSSVTLQGNAVSLADLKTQSDAIRIDTGTLLTQSSATATYLQNSSATATYINKNDPVAYKDVNQTWTAPQTLTSSVTVGIAGITTVNVSSKVVWADGTISTTAVVSSPGGAGDITAVNTNGGEGLMGGQASGDVSLILASTVAFLNKSNSWSGGTQTFGSSMTVKDHIVMSAAGGSFLASNAATFMSFGYNTGYWSSDWRNYNTGVGGSFFRMDHDGFIYYTAASGNPATLTERYGVYQGRNYFIDSTGIGFNGRSSPPKFVLDVRGSAGFGATGSSVTISNTAYIAGSTFTYGGNVIMPTVQVSSKVVWADGSISTTSFKGGGGAGDGTGYELQPASVTVNLAKGAIIATMTVNGIDLNFPAGVGGGGYFSIDTSSNITFLAGTGGVSWGAITGGDPMAQSDLAGLFNGVYAATTTVGNNLATETTNRTNGDIAVGQATGTINTAMDIKFNNVAGSTMTLATDTSTLRTDLGATAVATGTINGIVSDHTDRLNKVGVDTTTINNVVSANTSRLNDVGVATTTLKTDIDTRAIKADVSASTTATRAVLNTVGTDTTTLKGLIVAVGNDTATIRGLVNLTGVSTGTIAVATGTIRSDLNQVKLDTGTLRNDIKTIVISTPTAGDTNMAQIKFATPVTITRISCSTNVNTATIQFDERGEATPNTAGTDVMSGTLACDTDDQSTTSFANAGIAADAPLNLQIASVTGQPGIVRIYIEYIQ